MKQTAVICAAVLLFAAGAKAQAVSSNSLPVAPVAAASAPTASADTTPMYATNAAPTAAGLSSALASDPGTAAGGQEPPVVQSVFKTYNWQATVGYTFFRFYIVPGVTANTNGLNLGLVFYPGGHWVGADGEFIGTFGGVVGQNEKYVQAMGGPRFRWALPRGLELWGHGMVGRAHSVPQTPFGGQGAFAYEVGGGVDLNIHQRRWAYRFGANMVGTRFFGTYQYSPNASAGVVFKF